MSNKIHTTQWRRTHEKILEAMHKGARTSMKSIWRQASPIVLSLRIGGR